MTEPAVSLIFREGHEGVVLGHFVRGLDGLELGIEISNGGLGSLQTHIQRHRDLNRGPVLKLLGGQNCPKETMMGKAHESSKAVKKVPMLTPKEKKAAKRAKKSHRGSTPFLDTHHGS